MRHCFDQEAKRRPRLPSPLRRKEKKRRLTGATRLRKAYGAANAAKKNGQVMPLGLS